MFSKLALKRVGEEVNLFHIKFFTRVSFRESEGPVVLQSLRLLEKLVVHLELPVYILLARKDVIHSWVYYLV